MPCKFKSFRTQGTIALKFSLAKKPICWQVNVLLSAEEFLTMKFLLLLPVLALCELYLLIKLGSAIGAFNVVLWVVLSVLIGAGIVRNQGVESLMNLRAQAQSGKGCIYNYSILP